MTADAGSSIAGRIARAAVTSLAVAALATCGGGSNGPAPAPTPTGPRVTAITPATGSTAGGTNVTISGSSFAAGATVTIGGAAATNVVVVSAATITATTAAHAAGPADVTVTVGVQNGTLFGGFTYVTPAVTNSPPVVSAIAALGTRRNEPSQFADLDEEINVTATVQDAETPVSQLTFEWTAPTGTFTGTGAAVKWRAPRAASTPTVVDLRLTVIERYNTTDDAGQPATGEHRVSATSSVKLHDSATEAGRLATDFLTDFSNSSVAPETAVRFFTDSCAGKAAELRDVQRNRQDYTINSYQLGTPRVAVDFGGICARDERGDACVEVSCQWNSTIKATGKTEIATGTCLLTAVYVTDRWWLCDSKFDGQTTSGLRFLN